MKSVKISYIIITWNGLSFVRELLASMRNQMQREDVEVIIVDNHSTDGTLDFLSQTYPKLQLVCLSENRGVAYARNVALKKAQGEYLFIVDNDIQIADEAVVGMEQYMDEHPEVGLCGCKLLYPDGMVQNSCKPYPGIREKIRALIHRDVYSIYAQQMQGDEPFEPIYLIGACQMIRREAYQAVGDLDDTIFYGPEDCDYCLRTRNAGWSIMYLPTFSIIHHCQRRTHANPFSRLGWLHCKALLYFYWKYKKI